MKKTNRFTLILLFLSVLTFGQKKSNKDYLIAYTDTTSGNELTGYKSLKGEVIIKAKYQNGSDTLCGMAIVLNSKFEFVVIIPFIIIK